MKRNRPINPAIGFDKLVTHELPAIGNRMRMPMIFGGRLELQSSSDLQSTQLADLASAKAIRWAAKLAAVSSTSSTLSIVFTYKLKPITGSHSKCRSGDEDLVCLYRRITGRCGFVFSTQRSFFSFVRSLLCPGKWFVVFFLNKSSSTIQKRQCGTCYTVHLELWARCDTQQGCSSEVWSQTLLSIHIRVSSWFCFFFYFHCRCWYG